MTARKITYSLRHNDSQLMSVVPFGHGADRAAGQTRVTLARRCVR